MRYELWQGDPAGDRLLGKYDDFEEVCEEAREILCSFIYDRVAHDVIPRPPLSPASSQLRTPEEAS